MQLEMIYLERAAGLERTLDNRRMLDQEVATTYQQRLRMSM